MNINLASSPNLLQGQFCQTPILQMRTLRHRKVKTYPKLQILWVAEPSLLEPAPFLSSLTGLRLHNYKPQSELPDLPVMSWMISGYSDPVGHQCPSVTAWSKQQSHQQALECEGAASLGYQVQLLITQRRHEIWRIKFPMYPWENGAPCQLHEASKFPVHPCLIFLLNPTQEEGTWVLDVAAFVLVAGESLGLMGSPPCRF